MPDNDHRYAVGGPNRRGATQQPSPRISLFRLWGRVLPKWKMVSLPCFRTEWPFPHRAASFVFDTRVEHSIIDVQCQVPDFDVANDFGFVFRVVSDIVGAQIDLLAFRLAIGFHVDISLRIGPGENECSKIIKDNASLSGICTAFGADAAPGDTSYKELLPIVANDPAIFMALSDLVSALRFAHQSTILCARAVEGIRTMIDPGEDRKKAWRAFQTSLNVSQAYVRIVTDASIAPRHGDRTFIPGEVTTEVAKRAWVIMDRFLVYRKRGQRPLDKEEFPLLL